MIGTLTKKLLFVALCVCLLQSVQKAQTQHDSLSIIETIANYIEVLYSTDAARMEKALHKDLVKRGRVKCTQKQLIMYC